MRLHVFSYLLLALALGAAPAPQQPDSFRDEHKDLEAKSQRPDKQVSDLTSSVASKLPHIGSSTRRTRAPRPGCRAKNSFHMSRFSSRWFGWLRAEKYLSEILLKCSRCCSTSLSISEFSA